ncbi:major facilitator superfamily domain-containing protein [Pseudoneurospora amorphoporcata]|uniref:Major facilitator superfamily domain-containing protein n=1 Tax=Pseudoneurospora amorphoporcata TaxID=241081 RepID=A0AAN6P4U6_9PEZI|nr:major facilitator superfamily domain-containing protein [Pseudoneurospora amorphoporcata]
MEGDIECKLSKCTSAGKDQPVALVTEKSSSSNTNENDTSDGPESDDPVPQLHAKTFLAVAAVCLIYIAQLISLVGAGAQGQTIASHFRSPTNVIWFSAPITIGPHRRFGTHRRVSQAADYWGRKYFLVIPTFVGGRVGSLVVSRARSMPIAILGFSIIGIGFGSQPLLHVVTSEVLPRGRDGGGRGARRRIWLVGNALGAAVGLYVGGALNRTNDHGAEGFRSYFLMNMAVYVVARGLCWGDYNPPLRPLQGELSTRQKLGSLDWGGYGFLAVGLGLFSVGLSYSKNPYEWRDPQVSATFAVGMLFVIGLVVHETWAKKDGMFHQGLFTGNRNFAVAIFCVYSVMMILAAVFACVTGWYCAATRRVKWATFVAFGLFIVFFICMATTTRKSNTPTWGYTVFLGSALGMTLTTLVTVAQLSTPPELISVASGLIISIRSLSGSVGLAMYKALFHDVMKYLGSNVGRVVVPKGISLDDVEMFVTALEARDQKTLGTIPGVTADIIQAGAIALQDTFVVAFRHVWIAGACFVALAALVSLLLFDPKKEFNMHIDAPVEKEEDLHSV